MQLVAYIVVLIAALAWFGFSVYRRLTVLRAAQPLNRCEDKPERLMGVLKHVFGQARMISGDKVAGIMHFLIFWGFIVVLLNTLAFLIGGPQGHFEFPLLGREQPLGKLYFYIRDIFEVFVLGAVLFAIFRRLVVKPKRLHLSGEAVLILGFIGILMVTDWLIGGAMSVQPANAHMWFTPMEKLCASFIAHSGVNGAIVWQTVSWWIHLVVLLVFLNLLPLGKHFHVLLSIPGVFIRSLAPTGEMKQLVIDMEADDLPEMGVSRVEQLTWKNWFDSYDCTECGRCDHFCPANSTGKELSPRAIITNTRDLIYEHTPHIIRKLAEHKPGEDGDDLVLFDEGMENTPQFVGGIHKDNVLWACTTCGACDAHCPLFIEHVEPITEMRRHLVLEEEGRFPTELTTTFNGLERQGNPWNLPAHTRMEWAEGIEVPTLSDNPDAEYIWFVGCFQSLEERNKQTARAIAELLNKAGVSYAVLDGETCCGDPARRCGNEFVAQGLIEMNMEQFNECKGKKVFSACPHCFNTLKHEYQHAGAEFVEVLHHSQLLVRLLNSGQLDVIGKAGQVMKNMVFHDSCYLGRYNDIYFRPRQVLREACNVSLTETEFNRDKGYCCGAGGGMMFMEETEGKRINQWRYAQLTSTGAEEIAVACPFCMVMLDDAAKDAGGDQVKPVRDIALVLHEAVFGE